MHNGRASILQSRKLTKISIKKVSNFTEKSRSKCKQRYQSLSRTSYPAKIYLTEGNDISWWKFVATLPLKQVIIVKR